MYNTWGMSNSRAKVTKMYMIWPIHCCVRKHRNNKSVLITTQREVMTNYIKAKMDKTREIRMWSLCGDKYELRNHIKSKYTKAAQKKIGNRNAWFQKKIHMDFCKPLRYRYLENKTHKIIRDSEIPTDHPIQAPKSHRLFIKKNKISCYLMNFAIPANHRPKLKED